MCDPIISTRTRTRTYARAQEVCARALSTVLLACPSGLLMICDAGVGCGRSALDDCARRVHGGPHARGEEPERARRDWDARAASRPAPRSSM